VPVEVASASLLRAVRVFALNLSMAGYKTSQKVRKGSRHSPSIYMFYGTMANRIFELAAIRGWRLGRPQTCWN
jgi:hypothetical protein